jgi:anthranilate phosphoribosyltransferase
VDTCGTGGDGRGTFNISTAAALVAAAAGVSVAKHGNRSVSSKSGSADVLAALGVKIEIDPATAGQALDTVGITFLFAPLLHPAMREVMPVRRELGMRTIFNVLGPLTNPARPTASAVGCADRRMAPLMAEVFARRGDTALVFRGDDGLDELTTTTTSSAWLATGLRVHEMRIDPAAFGIAAAEPDDLRGGDRSYNAGVVHAVLAGGGGRVRDAVLLNAAAAIAVHDGISEPSTVDDQIAKGLVEARHSIDSGAAADLLARWVEASQRLR